MVDKRVFLFPFMFLDVFFEVPNSHPRILQIIGMKYSLSEVEVEVQGTKI